MGEEELWWYVNGGNEEQKGELLMMYLYETNNEIIERELKNIMTVKTFHMKD